MEPATTGGLFGLKLTNLVAGFWGGSVFLYFSPPMVRLLAVVTLTLATFCAAYIAPLFAEYFEMSERSEVGSGFLIGVFALAVIPNLLVTAAALAKDPLGMLKRLRGGE